MTRRGDGDRAVATARTKFWETCRARRIGQRPSQPALPRSREAPTRLHEVRSAARAVAGPVWSTAGVPRASPHRTLLEHLTEHVDDVAPVGATGSRSPYTAAIIPGLAARASHRRSLSERRPPMGASSQAEPGGRYFHRCMIRRGGIQDLDLVFSIQREASVAGFAHIFRPSGTATRARMFAVGYISSLGTARTSC